MAQIELITGIDIGSSYTRIAIGEVNQDNDRVNIIGLSEGESSGVSKGTIRSIEEVVDSIITVKTRAEKMTSLAIDHAIVGISGSHITAQDSKGVIAVSRADGEIREDDVDRVLEAAQAVSVPPNCEIIHVLPRTFSIDNQTDIKDPIGMNGVRLEVEAQIIEGQSAHIKNLTKAISLSGINIDDLVLSSLASAEATLTERQKDLGVVLVNMGAATTSILVFEEGDILLVKVLPIGSAHITNDIAIGLRTNIDISEKIKIQYGSTLSGLSQGADQISFSQIDEQENGDFSRKYLAEIIEARVEEIFHMVDKELKAVGRSGKLPAGAILTGGGAKLSGLTEVAKKVFRLPAAIGFPIGVESAIDKLSNPEYATAVGLVKWGHINRGFQGSSRSSLMKIKGFGSIQAITGQFKSIIRIFKP
ncbi:MAG: cell division protein FtsA [Parcubacteria group bacterium CG1_02_41_12]|nr:MAG: cell division protein FtsA [Parcubacteria group bacterium CG1_02_41_12]PIP67192.1 MAG: cell division protein FtsA [Parcubacteria group bacterium CG22_combo_CG10-13_8_21_14_all_41_9]PIZ81546.1 MAG: cell division protein FtsA [Parcubacteria group bacterium CG_4_10_14_0_2_um_filter_41_6]